MTGTNSDKQLWRIVLKGFKSIAKCDLELSKLNVLIGPNGAGKSNFIGFFRMLGQLLEPIAEISSSNTNILLPSDRPVQVASVTSIRMYYNLAIACARCVSPVVEEHLLGDQRVKQMLYYRFHPQG